MCDCPCHRLNNRPHLYPVLIRGDHVLILRASIKGWEGHAGEFVCYTNSGAKVKLFHKDLSYIIWHPKNAIVLLGRTR